MSLSSDSASAFSDYGPKPVIDHYGLDSELNQTAIMAVKFLYKCMYDSLPSALNKAERAQNAINLCVGKIGKRLETFNLYSDFFFPTDYKPNHDALMIALICDEFTPAINAEITLQDGTKKKYFEGIDDALTQRAINISKATQDLCDFGILDEDEKIIPLEAIFIAHVYAVDLCNEIKTDFDKQSIIALKSIKKSELKNSESFLRTETMIGIDLKKTIHELKRKIDLKVNAELELPPITQTVRFMPYLAIDNTLPRPAL